MTVYYVSTVPEQNGHHVVHAESCPQLEATPFRIDLGEYPTSDDAVAKAKILYPQVTRCHECSGNSVG